ncbi:uncharacterized protein [Anoplolepis gracilipes]|uniref:uncharacterized protein n=1 Tax=Anoplolepis gracilipes TaxID=354296 RepID=UPI003BA0F534
MTIQQILGTSDGFLIDSLAVWSHDSPTRQLICNRHALGLWLRSGSISFFTSFREKHANRPGIIHDLEMMADAKNTEDFVDVSEKLQGKTKMDVFKNLDALFGGVVIGFTLGRENEFQLRGA